MRREGFRHARSTVRRGWFQTGSVAALAIVLPLTACGANETERGCGAVGLVPNGVDVQVRGGGSSQLAGAVFKVCTPRTCTSTTRNASSKEPTTHVGNPGISSIKAVLVSITVHAAKGRVIVPTTRLTVVPIKAQPNGPGCDPTGYFATAAVTSTV